MDKRETKWQDRTSAEVYMRRAARDGRAVILLRPETDDRGRAVPKLWMCWLGPTLVACDDIGGDTDQDVSDGFLWAVPESATVADVEMAWRAWRNGLLADKRVRRKSVA